MVQDISQDARHLTEALHSIATVNQAVVETLRDFKTGKSSSSNSRFPIEKIVSYDWMKIFGLSLLY